MRLDEFIILTLLHSDEKMIAGRTLLQKTLYFLNVTLQMEFDFTPHYYGPYSPKIAETVEGLKSSGIVDEKIDKFPVFNVSVEYEPKKYTYILTKIGKEIAELIQNENVEEANKIKQELSLMKNHRAHRVHREWQQRSALSVSSVVDYPKIIHFNVCEANAAIMNQICVYLRLIISSPQRTPRTQRAA